MKTKTDSKFQTLVTLINQNNRMSLPQQHITKWYRDFLRKHDRSDCMRRQELSYKLYT